MNIEGSKLLSFFLKHLAFCWFLRSKPKQEMNHGVQFQVVQVPWDYLLVHLEVFSRRFVTDSSMPIGS